MKVLGITGWSGSGKTTLLTALIPCLRARGLTVSTIKHAHHEMELDKPGKDSFRHRHAGAMESVLAHSAGFALFSDLPRGGAADLQALLNRLAPVDLVLVEGFKNYAFPKLEVFRPSLRHPPLWREMDVLAVASDTALPDCPAPVLDLNAPVLIADFVLPLLGLDVR